MAGNTEPVAFFHAAMRIDRPCAVRKGDYPASCGISTRGVIWPSAVADSILRVYIEEDKDLPMSERSDAKRELFAALGECRREINRFPYHES